MIFFEFLSKLKRLHTTTTASLSRGSLKGSRSFLTLLYPARPLARPPAHPLARCIGWFLPLICTYLLLVQWRSGGRGYPDPIDG